MFCSFAFLRCLLPMVVHTVVFFPLLLPITPFVSYLLLSCCCAPPNQTQDSQAQNSQLRSRQDAFGGPREREWQGRVRVGRLDKPGQGRGPVVRRFRAQGGSADDLVRSTFGVRFQADGGEKKARTWCALNYSFQTSAAGQYVHVACESLVPGSRGGLLFTH